MAPYLDLMRAKPKVGGDGLTYELKPMWANVNNQGLHQLYRIE